jgi:hypothetical protein
MAVLPSYFFEHYTDLHDHVRVQRIGVQNYIPHNLICGELALHSGQLIVQDLI